MNQDSLLINEEWLVSVGFEMEITLRRSYRLGRIWYYPQCGHLEPICNIGTIPVKCPKTRGDMKLIITLVIDG